MQAPSGGEILALIEAICNFGPRWMGSPGAVRTADFIAEQFQGCGLKVERQPFSYPAYRPGTASLVVDGRQLACEPIALSRTTQAALNAPLIYGGQCRPEDFERLDAQGVAVNGAIVLSDNLRSFVAYPTVVEAGAAGMIGLTNLPGNIIRCGCARLDRQPCPIPAVALGGDDGQALVRQLAAGSVPTAALEVTGQTAQAEGCNIIGRSNGNGAGKLLITAHYDSFWNGVHAMDNAAGTATVISLARCLSERFALNLEFVVFGGEELGSWGAAGYVQAHRAVLVDIKAIVNLDTFGSNRSQVEIGVTPDLAATCRTIVRRVNIAVDCWNIPPRAASDQEVFVQQGVPAIWLANCGADPRYHTPLDMPSQMSAASLAKVAKLACALIRQLAG